jgi:hypothetical protein
MAPRARDAIRDKRRCGFRSTVEPVEIHFATDRYLSDSRVTTEVNPQDRHPAVSNALPSPLLSDVLRDTRPDRCIHYRSSTRLKWSASRSDAAHWPLLLRSLPNFHRQARARPRPSPRRLSRLWSTTDVADVHVYGGSGDDSNVAPGGFDVTDLHGREPRESRRRRGNAESRPEMPLQRDVLCHQVERQASQHEHDSCADVPVTSS